ncbi:hypothetical protein ACWKSP_13075 [Micromonosporaceae bacterium Da 78-11]
MASWILVPSLVALRDEFNALAPRRDKASDGSIGDTAHAQESSDHNPDETGNTPYEDADNVNEVHAIDVDADLRQAGWTMDRALEVIITRHREGRDDRLQNVIYNRRIWSRSTDWASRVYTGDNPHTEHAHFSARYTTAQESDTRPWGLLEDDVTKSEFIAWMTEWARSAAGREALAIAVLTWDPGKDASGKIKPGGVANPGADSATNPTVGPSYALNRAIVGSILSEQILAKLADDLGVAPVPPSIGAQLRADQALDAMPFRPAPAQLDPPAGAASLEDTVAALRAVLGDRAAEVGRLLAK